MEIIKVVIDVIELILMLLEIVAISFLSLAIVRAITYGNRNPNVIHLDEKRQWAIWKVLMEMRSREKQTEKEPHDELTKKEPV